MNFQVVVIGGGIAGVSAAYHLAADQRVALVEAEAQLAYHATGRSAALFFENYGAAPVRPLTRASRRFFLDPPRDLVDGPLASPRAALWIAREEQLATLDQIAADADALGTGAVRLSPEEVAERVPVIPAEVIAAGLWEPDPFDLDVAATHHAFLRGFRRRGGTVFTSSPVRYLRRRRRWEVKAGDETLSADTVVNAAGAWGDVVADLAGIPPVGLSALRRTAFMVAGAEAWSAWPMVVDVDHQFYFKPDGAQLLCSPADETPTEPGDARPDPVDVALAIERINRVTTLAIRSVRSQWAGLRTFAPDRVMVIGPEPTEPSFVWLVGQGGTGIQTAPAAGQLVASLVRQEPLSWELTEARVDPAALAPDRFR